MLIFAHLDDSGAANPEGLGRLWNFLGAFHPLVVHFPLALILTAALLELISVWKPDIGGLRCAIAVNLILGMAGALVAAPLGWLDASQMHFEPDLKPVLLWHRWLGTTVAAVSLLTTLFWLASQRTGSAPQFWIYRGLLWLLAIVVGITGHLGGLLVYGLDYFSPSN